MEQRNSPPQRYSAQVGLQKQKKEVLTARVTLDALPTEPKAFGKTSISEQLRRDIHSELVPVLLEAIHSFKETRRVVTLREINVCLNGVRQSGEFAEDFEEKDSRNTWTPQDPINSFERLTLPDSTKALIDDALTAITGATQVFEEWGLKQNFNGKTPALVINLFGPPGTGKTATAHAIARQLGAKIISADYSQIESKFVGDSAKNLDSLFSEAERSGAVLLFDEADILLSKRVASQSSSDHALNALRTAMLLWLDKFSGVCILATNNRDSYDRAFDRRILVDIKFDTPSAIERARILAAHIPKSAPLAAELSLSAVSELMTGFSGADIRDTVLKAALTACRQGRKQIEIIDFETAASLVRTARRYSEAADWMNSRKPNLRPSTKSDGDA